MVLQDTVSDVGLMTARSLRPRNESTQNGKWEVFGGWERVDCGQQELRVTHTTETWQGQTEGG